MFHFIAGLVCGVGCTLVAVVWWAWRATREPKVSNGAFEREAARIQEKCIL